MGRSLTRTRELRQLMLKVFDCKWRLGGLEDSPPPAQLVHSSLLTCDLLILSNNIKCSFSLDIQLVWLSDALWASLSLRGGIWPGDFDPKRKDGIGHGRSWDFQQRR